MFNTGKKEADRIIVETVLRLGKIRAKELFKELVKLGVDRFKGHRGLGAYIRSRQLRRIRKVVEKKHTHDLIYYAPSKIIMS